MKSNSPAWSRVPFHLLHTSGAPSVQARYYSSSSSGENNESNHPADGQTPTQSAPSRVASAFGFQSLSSLFEQPAKARYNKPREREESEKSTDSPDPKAVSEKESPASSANEGNLFQRSEPSLTVMVGEGSDVPKTQDGTHTEAAATKGEPERASPVDQPSPTAQNGFSPTGNKSTRPPSTRIRRHQVEESDWGTAQTTWVQRRANPFETRPSKMGFDSASTPQPPTKESPWGLEKEGRETVESILEPSFSLQSPSPEPLPETNQEPDAFPSPHQVPEEQLEPKSLTHVNSSGEARMVDVGAKASTKRVAIANTRVRFSNPEPLKLIIENTNKKGDVLGVARIAGIMAAKKTSDLIPLCHPIQLTKVQVNLELGLPRVVTGGSMFGSVQILAQVECTGQTGVEMEALTAASVAALTVYDMCKAVDKDMHLGSNFVAYKSGGKNGVYAREPWATSVGKEWFVGRGLEVPPRLEQGMGMVKGPRDSSKRQRGAIPLPPRARRD